jgi:hypothetical protein
MLYPSIDTTNELPRVEECRTQHVSAEFSNCLAEQKRYRCDYAFLFGDGYLCTHPNHREFR